MYGLGFLAILLIWWVISIYPDWLWFGKLGYLSVFWTMLLSKFALGVAVWVLLIIMLLINLYVARRISVRPGPELTYGGSDAYPSQFNLSGKSAGSLFVGLVLFISFIIAARGASQWDMVLRYIHQYAFGSKDPIFNKDIGFYVFSFPFQLFIQSNLLLFVVFSGAVSIAWYLRNGAILISNIDGLMQVEGRTPTVPRVTFSPAARKHLLFLGGILVLVIAWGYRLKMFNLLYSTDSTSFGAGYTDVHVRLPIYGALILLSLAFSLCLFVSSIRFRHKLILLVGAIWFGALFLLPSTVPILVEKFIVKPNELAKESRFIEYNITLTNRAYNLEKIKPVSFPVDNQLSMEDIQSDKGTIQNVRIWDKRPLLKTYRQLQAIRLYYNFNDVDVDRYHINNEYRQVNLSAREFVVNQLPPQADTWVNRHLIYTHGYGLTMSPVNEVTKEGLPHLLIKNLPPVVDFNTVIKHPEIYYGEKTDNYVFVSTKIKEFNYPKGDKNVYTNYQGTGGVPIGSFARKLLFSIEFLDPQILFTGYLSPVSRIMYVRRIDKRVRTIAPFLTYDSDPYLVLSGGRLYWIIDAYTTSNMYPYSARLGDYARGQLNYIRNSVKVTIDAFNGNVHFYVIDKEDPIIKSYSEIFPRLFKSFDQMPPDLKRHIRYPKDLFKIQANIYKTYHMKDVQVFYNQEDLWQIPDEIYGDARQKMQPYHIILRLPGESREEFVLMIPFTPSKKDNMIAWLAARCDLKDYGNLIVYKLPKEKLIFGPMQIEARVDQQTHISRELTLWGQRGSVVIRGNLLAIPIRKTFIYVEPVYLVAKQLGEKPIPIEGSQAGSSLVSYTQPKGSASLPELKRVIVAFGNRLVMSKNIESALFSLLGKEETPVVSFPKRVEHAFNAANLAKNALESFNKAKAYLRNGDWAGYGKEQKILEKILQQLAETNMKKQEQVKGKPTH